MNDIIGIASHNIYVIWIHHSHSLMPTQTINSYAGFSQSNTHSASPIGSQQKKAPGKAASGLDVETGGAGLSMDVMGNTEGMVWGVELVRVGSARRGTEP